MMKKLPLIFTALLMASGCQHTEEKTDKVDQTVNEQTRKEAEAKIDKINSAIAREIVITEFHKEYDDNDVEGFDYVEGQSYKIRFKDVENPDDTHYVYGSKEAAGQLKKYKDQPIFVKIQDWDFAEDKANDRSLSDEGMRYRYNTANLKITKVFNDRDEMKKFQDEQNRKIKQIKKDYLKHKEEK